MSTEKKAKAAADDDGTTDYCYSAECQYRLRHVCGRREPVSTPAEQIEIDDYVGNDGERI